MINIGKKIPPLSEKRLQKFWENIDKTVSCWLWRGCILSDGYGQFKLNSRNYKAHRISFYLAYGQPTGIVMHTCDIPRCCNPEHLRDGTLAENSADMVSKGRSHKPQGELHPHHKLNEQQVYEIRETSGTCKAVGRQYGVSPTLVSLIRTRKVWKFLK